MAGTTFMSPGSNTLCNNQSVSLVGSNTMKVTTFFACRHSEISSVECNSSSSPLAVVAGPCSQPSCQAVPLSDLIGVQTACYGDSEKAFYKSMEPQLTLAGMNAENACRKFTHAEPMCLQEFKAAGCSDTMIQTLMNAGQATRSAAVAGFLGHKPVLAMLAQWKSCVNGCGPQWQADMLAEATTPAVAAVQQKLAELQQTVFALTQNSYPAPGAPFHMLDGIHSFEQNWGQSELEMLRSTPEGQAMLDQPMTNENIVISKSCIQNAQAELSELLSVERASFFADYPGVEALHTAGKLLSPDSEDSDAVAGAMDIDTESVAGFCAADIRDLRPQQRVASKAMVRNRANAMSFDLKKAHGYSGKPHDELTNPWWEVKAKADGIVTGPPR